MLLYCAHLFNKFIPVATVVTAQRTKFMWPWIMQISFWKSTMQNWSSILGVNAESWMRHLNEFVTYLYSRLQHFAISCLNLLKSYDNFSISRVHNICIILYVYDMRDSSAVVGGEIYKQIQNTTNTLGRLIYKMYLS